MCSSVGTKVGTGLGSAMVGWLLAAANVDFASAAQSESTINSILFSTHVLPVIFLVITIIMIVIFKPGKTAVKAADAQEGQTETV